MRIVIEKLKMQSNPQNISENLEKICPENFKIQILTKTFWLRLKIIARHNYQHLLVKNENIFWHNWRIEMIEKSENGVSIPKITY